MTDEKNSPGTTAPNRSVHDGSADRAINRPGDVEGHVWARLSRAVHDRHAAYRWFTLATVSAGRDPEARIVVLRRADRAMRSLWVFTDARTAKVSALSAASRTEALFFDQRRMEQVRVKGTATLHLEGPVWAEALGGIPPARMEDYRRAAAPGTPMADAADAASVGAERHFALITITADQIDWLSLARDGHRRVQVWYDAGGAQARWVVP